MKAYYADRISTHRAKTPEGYLIALKVPIARTGVQKYRGTEIGADTDIVVDVYRDPAEVFAPATIASFEGKAVTSLHPPVFLGPENTSAYQRGHVSNVRKGPEPLPDGEFPLVADLVITDASLISQIEAGALDEISAGYECKYEPLEDGRYRQTNIFGNHVAIVASGRAGEGVRVLDEAIVEKEGSSVTAEEVKGLWTVFKETLGLSSTKTQDAKDDVDPGAVERNEEFNKKAKERAEMRNRDDDRKVKDDDDRKAKDDDRRAKDDDDRRAKDDDRKARDASKEEEEEEEVEKGKEKSKTTDAAFIRALDRNTAVMERVVEVLDRRTQDDDDDKKAKDDDDDRKAKDDDDDRKAKDAEDAEDADLIPVETMSGEEIPKNPIPGADQALDELVALKPLIAKSGSRKAIDAYNRAVRTLKGTTAQDDNDGRDGYKLVATDRKKPDGVYSADEKKAVDASADFCNQARRYHRRNPGEVEKGKESVN